MSTTLKENTIKILKTTATLSLTVYVILFFVFQILADKDKVAAAQLHALNRLIPSSYRYLLAAPQGQGYFHERRLNKYLYYYEKVLDLMPKRSDAHSMVGYCQYYLGHNDEAIAAFEKAIKYNPYFFWNHYNLGVVYYKNGEYKKAVTPFKAAIESKPALTFKFIEVSRIFHPMLQYSDDVQKTLKEHLREGFLTSHKLLVLSHYQQENYDETIQAATNALLTTPTDHDFFSLYAGMAAYKKEDYQTAVGYLREAINRNPRMAKAYQYLGLTWRALNQRPLAQKAEQTAERLKALGQESPDKFPVELQIY